MLLCTAPYWPNDTHTVSLRMHDAASAGLQRAKPLKRRQYAVLVGGRGSRRQSNAGPHSTRCARTAAHRLLLVPFIHPNLQGAGALGRLQDLCLAAEERAHSAERRASVADARCVRAESVLKDTTAALKEREKVLASAQVCTWGWDGRAIACACADVCFTRAGVLTDGRRRARMCVCASVCVCV